VALSLGGCAGTLEDTDRFRDGGAPSEAGVEGGSSSNDAAPPNANCGNVEDSVMHTSCASAGCHAATGSQGSLDLASPDILGRLAGKPATGGSGVLVTRGDPNASVLYTKLTAMPPFGSRMPLGAPLDDATLACVRDWIAAAR
jgi:hypothetical protein